MSVAILTNLFFNFIQLRLLLTLLAPSKQRHSGTQWF